MSLLKNRKKRHLHYNKYATYLLYPLVTVFAKYFLRVRITKSEKHIHNPCILLGEHASFFDPFIYAWAIFPSIYIHYIASDIAFRTPLQRFTMSLVGNISKKKSTSNMKIISEMTYVLKTLKESIGIFPEGVSTWDGVSNPLLYATSKFIKAAKLSVICMKSHGAHLSFPRWAPFPRRGHWILTYKTILTPHKIKSLHVNEIHAILSKTLYHNEYDLQKTSPLPFLSRHRAKYIERVLFACPSCTSLQKIESDKATFFCKNCANIWFIDIYGFFRKRTINNSNYSERNLYTSYSLKNNEKQKNNIKYTTLPQWNTWQYTFLKKSIKKLLQKYDSSYIIFFDKNFSLLYGKQFPILSKGKGNCAITTEKITFTPYKSFSPISIPIRKIQSTSMQNNEKLEFIYNKCTYQIMSKNPRSNLYKYFCAIEILHSIIK